jgi:hypothetical protein
MFSNGYPYYTIKLTKERRDNNGNSNKPKNNTDQEEVTIIALYTKNGTENRKLFIRI